VASKRVVSEMIPCRWLAWKTHIYSQTGDGHHECEGRL